MLIKCSVVDVLGKINRAGGWAKESVRFYCSAVKFAELCAKPSFRMHLRTESALERVIDLLKDAPEVPVYFFEIIALYLIESFVVEFESMLGFYSLRSLLRYFNIRYNSKDSTFDDWISTEKFLENGY